MPARTFAAQAIAIGIFFVWPSLGWSGVFGTGALR
jgi:hypothetical protein